VRGGYSVALVTTLKEVEGFVVADHARLCWGGGRDADVF